MKHVGTLAAALACAAALTSPAAAAAAEFHVEGTTAVYTGDPDRDRLSVNGQAAGAEFFEISDNGRATVTGGPCTRRDSAILCPVSQVTAARFDLGAGDDELLAAARDEGVTTTSLPLAVSGGPGNDVITGDLYADVLDGGDGNDDLVGIAGNDKVSGGNGDDTITGGDGDDVLDGGPGDDFVNGMDGNDVLTPGTGKDTTFGGAGDDRIDMRNGEVDVGQTACEEGTNDSIALDPKDRVLEYKSPSNSWVVEPSCEKVSGQAAPKPIHVFAQTLSAKKRALVVDVIEALKTTITAELIIGGKVVSRGVSSASGDRVIVTQHRTAAAKKYRNRYYLTGTARVTIVDSGGRKSVTTRKLEVPSI